MKKIIPLLLVSGVSAHAVTLTLDESAVIGSGITYDITTTLANGSAGGDLTQAGNGLEARNTATTIVFTGGTVDLVITSTLGNESVVFDGSGGLTDTTNTFTVTSSSGGWSYTAGSLAVGQGADNDDWFSGTGSNSVTTEEINFGGAAGSGAPLSNESWGSFTVQNVSSFTWIAFGNANDETFAIEAVAVPEPSSTALLGLGGLALIMRRRK
ncbi:PEP-CTERM sorting domain-containing protein [Rubritalea sp.]|uniref:PEP-CTERM sorting domain-containing protein n=1 Tax=Rubritalea sp. TaxID=2109375 RepID=UPI003EF7A894